MKKLFSSMVLVLNRIIHSSKLVTYVLIHTYYKNLLQKSYNHNVTQGLRNPKQDLIQLLQQNYFETPYSNRPTFRTLILGSFALAKHSFTLVKSQPRNAACKCGSGKKFKNCCMLKYKI